MSKLNNFGREFKNFALRGNMVDLAIGFTVGAAFTAIAKSLVDDIIMPVVGLILGSSNFNDFYILVRDGEAQPGPYATLADAQAAEAITINLGLFFSSILTFLIVALVMFFVVRGMNRLQRQLDDLTEEDGTPVEVTSRDCPYCHSNISNLASRCPHCTSGIEPLISEGGAA